MVNPSSRVLRTLALLILIAGVLSSVVVMPASGMRDPAAVYCKALNYTYVPMTAPDGGIIDMCTLPDKQTVDAWKFLQGEIAPEYSYCAKRGYRQEITYNKATCARFLTSSCAVCILPDGSKTEVTTLMNLNFRENFCWNSVCCDPAKNASCSFSNGSGKSRQDFSVLSLVAGTCVGILLLILFVSIRRKKQHT